MYRVAKYSFEFCTPKYGWNNKTLQGIFCNGLSETINAELVSYTEPLDFEILIVLVIQIGRSIRERKREKEAMAPFHCFNHCYLSQLSQWAIFIWVKTAQPKSLRRWLARRRENSAELTPMLPYSFLSDSKHDSLSQLAILSIWLSPLGSPTIFSAVENDIFQDVALLCVCVFRLHLE